MRISYNWLKDYIDLNISPERAAQLLTMAGFPVEAVNKIPGDCLFDIEVTSNRGDCLSFLGIARELSAITGSKLKMPLSLRGRSPKQSQKTGLLRPFGARNDKEIQSAVSVKVEDKKLCPRYTARVIRGVKVKESPKWLTKRIEAMGLRPVNNIVDITNFCLFETGEPIHAFDLDKISGSHVIIRRAKKEERVLTIDGIEKILNETDLVIADEDKVIAIAGVMGASNTEVTDSTKNILFEAAYFDPVTIRKTSRRLGLSTESSYRFERSVDISNIAYSSNRAGELVIDLAGGEGGEFVDIGIKTGGEISITLRYPYLDKILGLALPRSEVDRILESIGFNISSHSDGKVKLKAPQFRQDIRREIDCIEEVGRIYGYEKIKETIPSIVEGGDRLPFNRIVDNRIKDTLNGLGMDEATTYGLLSKKILIMSGLEGNIRDKNIVELKNPLTSDQEVMRPSLLPGLLNSMRWNINRKAALINLFELGKVYTKDGNGRFREAEHLSLGLVGEARAFWFEGARPASFFDLKGIVETLLSELGVDSPSFERIEDSLFSPAAAASITVNGDKVGVIGEISGQVLADFDIKEKIFASELDIDAILNYAKLEKRFKGLPLYPSVVRDMSIIVDEGASNAELIASMKSAGGSILKNVELLDRYKGKQIPEGKIGLTYRLEYQDLMKTLEDKDVVRLHANVIKELEQKFAITLR